MKYNQTIITLVAAASLVGCSSNDQPQAQEDGALPKGDAPVVSFTPEGEAAPAGKPSAPITVSYRIIGKPVVGQPVAVDLSVSSTLGPQPITLLYRINDASAMQLAQSQPDRLTIAPDEINDRGVQQVTVIPMREGRLYLNVSASVETEDGSMSTVTAIPIQVGDAPRELLEHGEVQTDEEGNAIRVLPADES